MNFITNFIKKHMSILIPAGIVVLALALLIPTLLMSKSLKEEMQSKSISMAKQITSLEKKVVSKDQYKSEEIYQESQAKDAEAIAALAIQTSQRNLLSYKIFPKPIDTSPQLFSEFGELFKKSFNQLVRKKMNALDCPSEREIQQGSGSETTASKTKTSGAGSAFGMPRGFGGSRQSSRGRVDVNDAITDIICTQRAEAISVYGNPADLGTYDFWTDYEYEGINEAVLDCWYSQLAAWIVEDVVDTIAKMNTESKNVLTAPVKRLLSVGFQADNNSSGTVLPVYVTEVGKGITTAWTRRLSNNEIDVIHFKLSVITSDKAALPFMKELCSGKEHKYSGLKGTDPEQTFRHNQITILDIAITPVIRSGDEHQLYRYGEDATVKLELVCEYAFNKKGYEEAKPESLKKKDEPEQDARGGRGRRRRR